MLKEIYCEKFIENGKNRPKIKFHNGLNTIIGTGKNNEKSKKSENSVGKSTLLMIIDFCFGGKEVLKSKAVKIIGNHTICFAFEFNGKLHCFMRVTDKENNLFKCDQNYQNPEKYDIEDFIEWLKHQYVLDDIELSFRGIVGTYFGFYGANKEISPKKILRTYDEENGTKQIRTLEKLFEKYSSIKEYIDSIAQSENRAKIKKQAKDLKVEISDFEKIDVKETEQKIAELKEQKQNLLQKQKEYIPELDTQRAKELAKLRLEHKNLASKRSRLLTRIENIKNSNFETIKPSKASYDALLEFFPNADIKKMEEIDIFHEKLSNILKEEHQEATDDYQTELEQLQTEIENLENKISSFDNEDNFTTAFLLEFSKVQGEIDRLNGLLEKEKDKKENEKQVKQNRKILKIKEKDILDEIELSINSELTSLSHAVLGNNIKEIEFSFPTNASYDLGSPVDSGTGTDYTSLILFDFAILHLTRLPALIHDSYLLSNIRGERLERLIKNYASITNKQVFLSSDEIDKLDSDTQALVNSDNICTIKLHQSGGELYGDYWGEKENSSTSK